VWIGLYIAYRRWYLDAKFGVHDALAYTLSGYPARHLYFVFVILGLYAITPLMRILVDNLSRRQLAGLTSACIALSWFNSYLGNTLGVPTAPNALSFFLPYVGYFLAGYFLRDVVIRGWRLWLVVAGVAVTIVGEAIESYLLRDVTPISKFSALTIAMSLLMFVALLQVGRIVTERGYQGRVLGVLAGASFGVYLVHVMVLDVFTDVSGLNLHPANVIRLVVTVASVIIISWTFVLLVQRIPVLKRFV
ncbi:MAG: acyltransferase family protein, partial [Actinobacteria bacterium]|nr:acyltransferase family protein [Actinomycetota bacterium]